MHHRARLRKIALVGALMLCAGGWPLGAGALDSSGLLVPTSGWLVGPATLLPQSIAGSTQPCLMSNQYHNGYGLRLSGGGEILQAIALDVRKPSFKQGEYYPVVIQLDGGGKQTMAAQAHNADTIVINTAQLPDLYDKIKKSETVRFELGDEQITLALFGVGDGFARLEDCFKTISQRPAAPPSQMPAQHATFHKPAEQPPAPVSESAPPSPQDTGDAITAMLDRAVQNLRQGDGAAPASEQPNPQSVPPPAPQAQASGTMLAREWVGTIDAPSGAVGTPESIMRWRAVRGGNVRDILARWCESAGVTLDWRATGDHIVPGSLSLQGRFEEAIAALAGTFDPSSLIFQIQKDESQPMRLVVSDGTGR